MDTKLGLYDADLAMFVEPRAEPDQNHLLFQRWLVLQGHHDDDLFAGTNPEG